MGREMSWGRVRGTRSKVRRSPDTASCPDIRLSFPCVAFRGSSVIIRSFCANVHTNSSLELPVSSPLNISFCMFYIFVLGLCVIDPVGACGRSWGSPVQGGVPVSCEIGRSIVSVTGWSLLVGQGGRTMMRASRAQQPPMECNLVARPV